MRAPAPERTCIGCRRKKPAAGLVRLVQEESGALALGAGSPGRGAWLCAADDGGLDPECFELAVKRRAFGRAFRQPVSEGAMAGLRTKVGKRARMDGRGRDEMGHDEGNFERRRED